MRTKNKLIILTSAILFIIISISTITIMSNRIKVLNRDLDMTINNLKASILENNNLTDKSIEYQFTIEQLKYSNDSITSEMNRIRKQLGIKDKNIERLEYLLETASKADTLTLKDTIFVDNMPKIDTLISDDWYKCLVELEYPNTIIISPEFKSEKYIITSWRKETIKPANKCKFIRAFQRKQKILEVEVVEENPYISINKQKFINIIK